MSPYWNPVSSLHGYGYDRVRDDYKIIRCLLFFPLKNRDLLRLNVSQEDVQHEISYRRVWDL